MPHTYSDIKRYDLNPAFILQTAKRAVADLGWTIQRETNSELVAALPKINGYTAAVFTLNVHHGYVMLKCEAADSFIGSMRNGEIVNQFIQALDKLIAEVPAEKLSNLKDEHKLSFK